MAITAGVFDKLVRIIDQKKAVPDFLGSNFPGYNTNSAQIACGYKPLTHS